MNGNTQPATPRRLPFCGTRQSGANAGAPGFFNPPMLGTDTQEEELSDFQKKVYAAVRQIPQNEAWTYGQVAATIGHPKAARAVGTALAKNPWPHSVCHKNGHDQTLVDERYVPCHRVVASNPSKLDSAYLGRSDEASICRKRQLREMDAQEYKRRIIE